MYKCSSRLATCLLALSALIVATEAGFGFKHYRVPGTPTKNAADALRVLRAHMHPRETNERRCKLITYVLFKQDKAPMNQFDIWRAAKQSDQDLDSESGNIPVDNLVQYYTNALEQLTSGNNLDTIIEDVTGCMNGLFGSNNLRIRKILESKDLAQTISQWQQITREPSDFFLDPQYKHPKLKLERLTAPVAATLLKIFNGDKQLMESKFYSAEQEAARLEEAKKVIAKTKELVDKFFAQVLKDDTKWTDEGLCHVYSDIVMAAKGSISEETAIGKAQGIQAEIDSTGIAPHQPELDEESIMNLVDVTRKSIELTPKDHLWQDLTGCIELSPDYAAAAALLNSRMLRDKLEEAQRAESAAAA